MIQDIATDELAKQDTESDVKYQDIIYHMDNASKTVCSKDQIHIDFFKAMSEMKNLDWKYKNPQGRIFDISNTERALDAAQSCYRVLFNFLEEFPDHGMR